MGVVAVFMKMPFTQLDKGQREVDEILVKDLRTRPRIQY
jgi:hypothetical protein